MSKHTPGPWEFKMGQVIAKHPHDHSDFARNAIATIHQAKCSHCDGYPKEANGYLVAAAPELLKAAYTALALLRGSGFTDNTKAIIELRIAINKAEGM